MRLLAIDPGSTESAWLVYDVDAGLPVRWAKDDNLTVRDVVNDACGCHLFAYEMIASYGMAVGADVFETVFELGAFVECWIMPASAIRVYRREVKLHLCNSARAKDANVRQALIDRYGGKEKAIGRKATPGPLYGISGDCWSALGVAVTAAERGRESVQVAA